MIPIENGKYVSDRFDLLIFKKHYVVINKLHVLLGNHKFNYISRQCLSSYSRQNVLLKCKQQREQQEVTVIRTSNDSHLFWKKEHFPGNQLFYRIHAVIEADIEIDVSDISNKKSNIFKQNPVCNV